MRTHTCGELREKSCGERVKLCGWVHRRRNFGQLVFIDLRDRHGITQLVFNESHNASALIADVRSEWTLSVEGIVRERKDPNLNIPTGKIEIDVNAVMVLSKAETPPFELTEAADKVSEELRLEYRYLDMRRGVLLKHLELRHKTMLLARQFLDRHHFIEVQTPILSKSSPEGARDYLVPSRIHPQMFYALPQSPQLFKQMLMIGGCDRYFQIAPCFRDEDLRADRQPEFYQIDIEMSFTQREALFSLSEQLVQTLFKETIGKELKSPFPHITYQEALRRFGTDKPDMRFGMELVDLGAVVQNSECALFTKALGEGGIVRAITVKKGAAWPRKKLDTMTETARGFGLGGLAWIKLDGELKSPLLKFFDVPTLEQLKEVLELEEGDCALIAAGHVNAVLQTLDHLRRQIAVDMNLIDADTFKALWVTDFPLFEWDEDEKRYIACHHPFTAPLPDSDKPLHMQTSSGYDLVINGYEVAGGSVRIHDYHTQMEVFEALGLSKEEAEDKFSALLTALKSGAPPHLGIAFGVERLMMLLTKRNQIRDVIAFPKTTKASDLMMRAPSSVSKEQLKELGF